MYVRLFGSPKRHARQRRDGRAGRYGFWPMVLVLTVLWLTSLRGDPPPSLSALAVINALFFAVLLSWAEWMHRARPVSGA